jgi:glycerol-3-phosphate O-acyltransferase
VGEWARVWPLSALVRAMGAYFVRRNSKDELYRRVLERYIAMATEAGVPQALFPEGGLTRDGLIREPRLGVIDYMMRGFRRDAGHDVVFVPLGINYDRVLEDRSLLRGLDPGARRVGRAAALWNTLAFCARNLRLMWKSEWHRFGYACVNFGSPVSMRAYCRARGVDFEKVAGEERRRETAALGEHLMRAVGRIVPVVPVPLMATVFVRNPERRLASIELKTEVERIVERLERSAARVYVPRRDLDYALDAGLRMLLMRHLVEEKDGTYVAREEELPLLRYYANSIAHLVEEGLQ